MRPALWAGAVAVEDSRLLLVRGGAPHQAGVWSLPAVEVAPDEPLVAAAVRAVDEVAGAEAVVEGLLGYVEDLREGTHRVLLVFEATVLADTDLAAPATWVGFEDVTEVPVVPGVVELLVDRGILRVIA